MASLAKTGKYGDINAAYSTTMEYYVVKYVYDDFTLKDYTTADRQVSKVGKCFVRA